MKQLLAPKIDHYLRWLGDINYRQYDFAYTYDERSYELLDELYKLLKERLKPVDPQSKDSRTFELRFRAKRGTIEDFGSYEEYFENEVVENYDQFLEMWKDYYPDEEVWYSFAAVEDDYINYRAISVGRKFVIELDPRKEKGYVHDISEFVEWILDSVKQCIRMLENGTYNDTVAKGLPPQHRTGTITRKELWEIFPESKAEFFEDISQEDVSEFIAYATEQLSNPEYTEYLPAMTANDFYCFCSLGYRANNYSGAELTPKEQYYRHADGRDDGLSEIDPDSSEAFAEWYADSKRFGGHPWEVCRGGNSTHVSLYVHKTDEGYSLKIEGSSLVRTIETVKFYLALKRSGIPVKLINAQSLIERFNGSERVGVVPEGVFPRYCSLWFPDDKGIIAYMNLPYEQREETTSHCIWQKLSQAELVSDTKSGTEESEVTI